MKVLNIKGIVILAVILLVIQLVSGLIISPALGPLIIDNINKAAGTKISVGKISVWPLTLSCSLKDVKVFDPDREEQRIAWIRKASLRVSPLRLLSKQVVLSSMRISGAEIDLKSEPDGSFNVQKLARGTEAGKAPAGKTGIFDRLKGKKDWFGRIYNMIKDSSSKETVEKKRTGQKEARKVKKEVQDLPKGRRVLFKTLSDEYVFQIRDFVIKNSSLKLETADKQHISIEKAAIVIKNLGIDPVKGACFDRLSIQGNMTKEGRSAGTFDLDYAQSFRRDRQRTVIDVSAKNIDLAAVNFIYEDSLPVDFTKGTITIRSDTTIINDGLDSANSIILKDHNCVAKSGRQMMVGVIPLTTVCNVLNKIDPVKLKFKIAGTVENPRFKDLQDILISLVKPYLTDVLAGDVEEKAKKAIGDILEKKIGSGLGDKINIDK
ncbi:MAG: AsmA family protein [Candidatus Omnitrophica bacterium]|nr:AsmA family protein [Candidatus Omnitrophota bacterium]